MSGFDPSTATLERPAFDPSSAKPAGFDASSARPSGSLDGLISAAATKHGVDRTILARLIQRESGGRNDAVSPVGARGVAQFMPGTAAEYGVNVNDPASSIDGAAHYLADLRTRFGGDMRKAVAAYNAGAGAVEKYGGVPPYRETQNYVTSILGALNRPLAGSASAATAFDPTTAKPTTFDPSTARVAPQAQPNPIQRVQRSLAAGKPLGKALLTVPELRGVAKTEANLRLHYDIIKAHPIEALTDLFGTGGRLVGEGLRGPDTGTLAQSLHELGQAVFMTPEGTPWGTPSQKYAESIRDRTTESAAAFLHLPTRAAVDAWVKAHVPAPFRPYATAVAQGGRDTVAQSGVDPTTYMGGALVRGGVGLVRGAHTAMILHAAAAANDANHFTKVLAPVTTAYAKAARSAGEAARVAFQPRADLHRLFNGDGVRVRTSIENSEFHKAGERAAALRANPSVAAQHLAIYQRAGVKAVRGYSAEEFAELSATEQTALLAKASNELRDVRIARRTQSMVEGNPDLLRPGVSAPTNWRSVKTFDDTSKLARAGTALAATGVTKALRDVMRVSIFLDPAPHGMKNVGQLAYLAGGFPAVFRGLKAMAPGGIDDAARSALERYGAMPSYTQHTIEDSIWAKIPGVGPVWRQAAGGMQNAMTRMEEGWRVGLYETLEKRLGPALTEKDRLIRAAIVNERLGDYRNQSAFVHLFEAMGGPFVAFRLGIVPANVIHAIQENPARVLLALRGQENTQRERPSVRSKTAGPISRGPNELEVGGPIGDFSRMVTDPLKFGLSPSTLGPLGEIEDFAHSTRTGSEEAAALGQRYVPGVAEGQIVSNAVSGGAMPGQKMTLTDRLISSTLEAFAVYFYKLQTAKQQHAQVSRERKAGP